MQVKDWMRRDVVVVSPTTPAAECRQLMRTSGIRQLPVADDQGLVGCLHDAALLGVQAPSAAAGDLMEPPLATASPDEPLREAVLRFTRFLEEAMFVVQGRHVVGVITEHDLCERAQSALPPSLRVREVASSPFTIDRCETVSAAREQMRRRFVRHLVVLDEDKLLGVISRRDLGPSRGENEPLGDVVQGPIQWTIGWEVPLREAAAVMVRHRIGCLPVVSDLDANKVEGVVCRSDIVNTLLRSGLFGEVSA